MLVDMAEYMSTIQMGENIIHRDLSIDTQKIRSKTQKKKGISSVTSPQGLNFLPLLLECSCKAKADVAVVQIN